MDPITAAHAARQMGLQLPSPAWIFGCILFSLAGLAAWRYGKLVEHGLVRWLGVALMLYPYLVGSTWLLYAVGITLCGVIWVYRPRRD